MASTVVLAVGYRFLILFPLAALRAAFGFYLFSSGGLSLCLFRVMLPCQIARNRLGPHSIGAKKSRYSPLWHSPVHPPFAKNSDQKSRTAPKGKLFYIMFSYGFGGLISSLLPPVAYPPKSHKNII